jgi:hypothetical protein
MNSSLSIQNRLPRRLQRAARVQLALGFYVGRMRQLRGGERAKVRLAAVDTDSCPVLASALVDAKQADLVVRVRSPLVLRVHGRRGDPEIRYAVVGGVAVAVIHQPSRPNMVDIEPRQSVGSIALPVHFDSQGAARSIEASDSASRYTSIRRDAPSEDACLRAIPQQRSQTSVGDHQRTSPTTDDEIAQRKVTALVLRLAALAARGLVL